MKKFFVLFCLIALLICNANAANIPKAEVFTLKNGMEVVLVPNNKMPVVSHMVWYKIGAADEAPGKSGIAHFLEHLMFKATKKYKSGEFSKKIASVGGNDNAFTDTDYTAYYQNIPKSALELAMELESDRMENITFDEKEVLKERDVILEERRMRIDNDPRALLQEQMKAALYLNHPYGRPLIGWYHEMAKLNAADAKQWHQNYYNPANAVLVVSGDISKQELLPMAEKYYGKIPAGQKAVRGYFTDEPVHIAPVKVSLTDSKVQKEALLRYYLAPSQIYGEKQHAHALALLSYLLGGSDTSIMYRDMVVRDKKATLVSSYYDDLKFGPTIFVVSVVPVEGVSLADLENSLDEIIQKIITQGVDKADLIRAKKATIAESIYAREDLKTLANAYGAAIALGLGVGYVDDWDKNINAVTAKQVQQAAKYLFDAKGSVTGYLSLR